MITPGDGNRKIPPSLLKWGAGLVVGALMVKAGIISITDLAGWLVLQP